MSSKVRIHTEALWEEPDWSSLPRSPLHAGSGRGALFLVTHPRAVLLERAYRHGGIRRLIFPDYFMAGRRPAHEFAIHKQAFQAGIATPEPVGWAEEAALPGLRRYFYYSRYLQDTQPLPQRLAARSCAEQYAWQIAVILWQLYREGIYHHDLNLNNWLANGQGKVYLIDFDRARSADPDRTRYLTACLRRMVRSARRLGLSHRRRLFFRLAILSCHQFDLEVRTVLAGIPSGQEKQRWYHRWLWKITGGHYRLD